MRYYMDNYRNGAVIEQYQRAAYYGGPITPQFRLVVFALWDNHYVYHVSVHPTMEDAEKQLSEFSCGTFDDVTNLMMALSGGKQQ